MNKTAALLSVFAAFVFMSALPAYSAGTGPYGVSGPSADYNVIPGGESQHLAFLDGTGPYGLHRAYGAFGTSARGVEPKPIANKDECLLVAINCGTDYISLERKIENLRKEISKGKSVYTDDELNILRGKLDNATKTLEFFRHDGARNLYKYPGD